MLCRDERYNFWQITVRNMYTTTRYFCDCSNKRLRNLFRILPNANVNPFYLWNFLYIFFFHCIRRALWIGLRWRWMCDHWLFRLYGIYVYAHHCCRYGHIAIWPATKTRTKKNEKAKCSPIDAWFVTNFYWYMNRWAFFHPLSGLYLRNLTSMCVAA